MRRGAPPVGKMLRRAARYALAQAERPVWALWGARANAVAARNQLSAAYGAKSAEERVTTFFAAASTRLLVDADSHREAFLARWGGDADFRARVLDEAEAICRHEFDLLGSGPVPLGNPIPWHLDFKSNHTWPRRYWKAILIYRPWDASDVKVPWELSRFQHSPALGKAYWLTGDERYAREFQSQVGHWMAENPPGVGVNWTCPMEVAIRAINLLHGAGMFRQSVSISLGFWESLMESLYAHGTHIRENLEYHPVRRGNHYLADVVGLAALGSAFRETSQGTGWLSFATCELRREMEYQVYPDGVGQEMSTAYHRLLLELFWVGALFVSRAEFPKSQRTPESDRKTVRLVLGESFVNRMECMFDFVWRTARPDGKMPLVGDHDDGRVHLLGPYRAWEKDSSRHALAWGGEFFGRREWSAAASEEGWEEAWWYWPHENLAAPAAEDLTSAGAAFSEGGFFVMRLRGDFLLARCGPVGVHGAGHHDHCDHLSFEAALCGVHLVVDPGCFTYTSDPAERFLFRSTAYHNTVRVDGEEQNLLNKIDLFAMRESTFSKLVAWETGDERDIFEGRHHGYERLEKGLVHTRRIVFDKRVCAFAWRDSLPAVKRHVYEWFLHLDPKCRVEGAESTAAIRRSVAGEEFFARAVVRLFAGGKSFRLETSLEAPPEIEEGWMSRSYGRQERTSVIHWRLEQPGGVEEAFVLLAEEP